MVAHQAEGENVKVVSLRGFGDEVEEIIAVRVVKEDILKVVPASHDMLGCLRELDAPRSRHD